MTMKIEANLLPTRIKNKKINSAVGALFKTIKRGFKKVYNFSKYPAKTPKIIENAKEIRYPINNLKSVHPMHL